MDAAQVLLSRSGAIVGQLRTRPFAALYGLQALIYVVAAAASWYLHHRSLAGCYVVSSLVHWVFGLCHYLDLK